MKDLTGPIEPVVVIPIGMDCRADEPIVLVGKWNIAAMFRLISSNFMQAHRYG